MTTAAASGGRTNPLEAKKWDNPLDIWPAELIKDTIENHKRSLAQDYIAERKELEKVLAIRDRRNTLWTQYLCEELAKQIQKNPSGRYPPTYNLFVLSPMLCCPLLFVCVRCRRSQLQCLCRFGTDDESSVLLGDLHPAVEVMNPDNYRFGQWTFRPSFPEVKLLPDDTTSFPAFLTSLVRAKLYITIYKTPADIANDGKRSTALYIFKAQMKGRGFLVEYEKDEENDEYEVTVSLC